MNRKALIGLTVAVAIVSVGSLAVLRPLSSSKKVLFIDSYHQGYAWSDGITAGIQNTLAGSGVDLRIHRMDTKRNGSEAFKKQAALTAKAVIDEYQPDVVIAADDNASKYLIVPYYRGGDLPFVFAGVNWDASVYGFPANNVTGMVEVSRPNELMDILRTFSGGAVIGSLTGDTATSRKENEYYTSQFGIRFDEEVYVKTFDQWETGLYRHAGSGRRPAVVQQRRHSGAGTTRKPFASFTSTARCRADRCSRGWRRLSWSPTPRMRTNRASGRPMPRCRSWTARILPAFR